MNDNDDSSDIVSTLLGDESSRRSFMSDTAKFGAGALAFSAFGGGVAAGGGTQMDGATVTFHNQTSDGSTVMVASTTLPDGGFVAIHDATLLEGEVLGSVVGVSELLDAGEHEDVEVTLFEGVPGAEFEQSALQETQVLIPMPHQNTNDNESYDFITSEGQEDGPYTRAGAPVVGLGFVSVGGETTTAQETTTE